MSLREFLSAIAPQIGAMMPDITKEEEKTMPDHRLTSDCATPSSLMRYIGRNGMSIV